MDSLYHPSRTTNSTPLLLNAGDRRRLSSVTVMRSAFRGAEGGIRYRHDSDGVLKRREVGLPLLRTSWISGKKTDTLSLSFFVFFSWAGLVRTRSRGRGRGGSQSTGLSPNSNCQPPWTSREVVIIRYSCHLLGPASVGRWLHACFEHPFNW